MENRSAELWPLAVISVSAAVVAVAGIAAPSSIATTVGDWLGFAGSAIGGLFTVLAAYIAWRSVKPQIDEARKQSAAAAIEALARRAEQIEVEFNQVSDAGELISKLRDSRRRFASGYNGATEAAEFMVGVATDITEFVSKIDVNRMRDAGSEALDNSRRLCRDNAASALGDIQLVIALTPQFTPANILYGPEKIKLIDAQVENLIASTAAFQTARLKLRDMLKNRLIALSSRISVLDEKAVGVTYHVVH